MSPEFSHSNAPGAPARFLIVQRGAARLEVVPLLPGARISIGRASSNRIIVNDAKCSRQHCEVSFDDGDWSVRDLDSRNGVTVDGMRVDRQWRLELGQTIGVGECTLVYSDREPEESPDGSQLAGLTPYAVIERKTGTRYDPPSGRPISAGRHGLAELFLLGRQMGDAQSISELADVALDGLLRGTPSQIGAVLIAPPSIARPAADDLRVAAVRKPSSSVGAEFSDYLSELVLTDREAILAHDISGHRQLAHRDSLNELAASSAICAPIRGAEDDILGVIHLYSTDATNPLNAEHLEFALAVADQAASRLATLQREERLAADLSKVESHVRDLTEQLEVESELVGTSASLDKLRRAIARVAPTDATVLIRGESGVGKELVARAVHFNSPRQERPFVCVNCAALTESLLESELFGHEKGAFTGAAALKAGKFEQAHGGTLFLDEIGEMSPEIQSKFLRVLEGQPFERVGGGKAITVDVRVVTATNRDLEDAVQEGKFRSDLYYRLQVIEITVPPLRSHPEDIPQIAQHFVQRFARKSRPRVQGFNREALSVLCRHSWPGNVRELRNVVERAVILSEGNVLTPEDITLSRLVPPAPAGPREPAAAGKGEGSPHETLIDPRLDVWASLIQQNFPLDDLDRIYMEAVLIHFDWNKSQAARLLGIERTTLDRRLKKYGMKRPGATEEEEEEETVA